MTKKIVSLFASVALLGSGAALANDGAHSKSHTQSSQQSSQDAFGGSGTSQAMGEKEISGTVIKSSGDELKLRTENGVISVKVNKETRFQEPTVKRIKDLKEGQQVRTSFTVVKDDNVAKSVSLASGLGGSGLETDSGINQGLDTDNKMHQDLNPDIAPKGDVTGNPNPSGGKTF